MKILSTGQCNFDHAKISHAFKKAFDVKIERAHTGQDTFDYLNQNHKEQPDVILINRIIDRDGSEGVELIKKIRNNSEYDNISLILVSDLEPAQQAAQNAGAISGFGKSDLSREKLRNVLKQVPGDQDE